MQTNRTEHNGIVSVAVSRKTRGGLNALAALMLAALLLGVIGCEEPDPNVNTPTSGRLVVYVDELYAGVVQQLADSFMVKTPNTRIELRPMPARMAVEALIEQIQTDTATSDTAATYAAIIGRGLLGDERQAIDGGKFPIKEYVLGYDGIALAVAQGGQLTETTQEQLQHTLRTQGATLGMLDSTLGGQPARFLLPDQNSSTYMAFRAVMLGDSDITAPAGYYQTADSVLDAVAAGEGIGVLGWYRAHQDSARVRILRLGYTDSTGAVRKPVRVHPISLVTDAYPLKQPLTGCTFAGTRSLAIGFLAWLAKSEVGQRGLTNAGFQPEGMKLQIVLPEEDEE